MGILHQIDSETSTVALEQVTSYGTEGRRGGSPDDEIPASDHVYDYIVFKGSDVKDLTILEPPQAKQQPQVPDDPAIIDVSVPTLLAQAHGNLPAWPLCLHRCVHDELSDVLDRTESEAPAFAEIPLPSF